MLIRIMYHNGTFDMVKPELLDTLIENRKITSFKRSDRWAVVNRDAIRRKRSKQEYQGQERRAS